MRIFTVNVIEYEGETIRQVVSFMDPEGVQEAEKLFAMILQEHGVKGVEIEFALDDGFWDSKDGYQVFLTHST